MHNLCVLTLWFRFPWGLEQTDFCLSCLQEIKDLDELISEIGGELGKFAEEEKSQALSEIEQLQVFLLVAISD